MDIFDRKSVRPMLIEDMRDAFDDSNYIYELKLDGERCVAYLDKEMTTLQNKRGLILNPRYPELCGIHKTAKVKCILDGELAVLVDGKPDFSEIQRRSLLSNKFRINLALQKHPACFTAFDILYYQDEAVMDLPLMQRKELLTQAVHENGTLAVSRYIEEKGSVLYSLAADQGLEGVVAKKRSSLYYPGKRTKDWIKFKYLLDDDFVICGYVPKENSVVSIILGQYEGRQIIYKGHVPLGISQEAFKVIQDIQIKQTPLFRNEGNHHTVWLDPVLVCTVKYMKKTASGMLRQPSFKGLREDKKPEECTG